MNKKRAIFSAVLTGAIVLGTSLLFIILVFQNLEQEHENELKSFLKNKEKELSAELLEKSQLAQVLSGYISATPNINDSTFQSFSKSIDELYDIDFLSLQWAPDGIISFVYPKKENQKVVGLNLFTHKTTRDIAYKSFMSQKPHINGPVELVQGGLGVIFRVPVFIPLPNNKNKFVGFSAVVYKWNNLISKLNWQNENYEIALRFQEDSFEKKFFSENVFYGKSDVFNRSHRVISEVNNSFGKWQMGVAFIENNHFASSLTFYIILSIILTILMSYWVYSNSIKVYYIKLQKELLEVKNKEIEKQIGEKIILLNEVHHRVKNNFQLISSLARLQSHELKDPKSKEAFEEFSGRISSLALTHEQLYKKENIQKASIKSYVESLCHNLLSADQKRINAELSITEEEMPVDQVISLGIIINELITNSIKYAFPSTESGSIKIYLQKLNSHYQLKYSDSGKKLPNEILVSENTSFGIQLIKSITEQIDGKISQFQNENESGFVIEF